MLTVDCSRDEAIEPRAQQPRSYQEAAHGPPRVLLSNKAIETRRIHRGSTRVLTHIVTFYTNLRKFILNVFDKILLGESVYVEERTGQ